LNALTKNSHEHETPQNLGKSHRTGHGFELQLVSRLWCWDLVALKQALFELKIDPKHHDCFLDWLWISSTAFIKSYGFHSWRASTPVATAMKMANHKMTVIVIGGDGDVTESVWLISSTARVILTSPTLCRTTSLWTH
jgi:hypothetical protein